MVVQDRITWSAAPRMVQVVLPYIVSLLANDKVEIHDVSSLLPVQVRALIRTMLVLTAPIADSGIGAATDRGCRGGPAGHVQLQDGRGQGRERVRGLGHSRASAQDGEQWGVVRSSSGCWHLSPRLAPGGLCMCVCRQVPLAQQVEQLVASGSYEDAIAICSMFEGGPDAAMEDRALLADIDREPPVPTPVLSADGLLPP